MAVERLRTSELILEPFLDTGTTPEEKDVNRAELAKRGYPHWVVRILRLVAAPGLWWQLFVWEWFSLTLADVVFGYGVLFGLVGVMLLLGSAIWWDLALVGGILVGSGIMLTLVGVRGWRRDRQARRAA